jgi:transcriptional regulator with XRE-family HTH domain
MTRVSDKYPMIMELDPSNVEASIQQKSIGHNIRRLRLKQSMGLIELGRRTGLSASFLSQLETGKVVPTLRNLARIALVFRKDLAYFFREERGSVFRVSRAKDRPRLSLGKSAPSVLSESLSMLIPDRNVIPCIAEFLTDGAPAVFCPTQFSGLELAYVLEGSVTVFNKTGKQLLQTADSAWIDGNAERRYERYGEAVARALIITFPKQG